METIYDCRRYLNGWCENKEGISVLCVSLKGNEKEFHLENIVSFSVGHTCGGSGVEDEKEERFYFNKVLQYLLDNPDVPFLFQPVNRGQEPFFTSEGIGLGCFRSNDLKISFDEYVSRCRMIGDPSIKSY